MKKPILLINLFFLTVRCNAAPSDIAKAIHYVPPTNFWGGSYAKSNHTDPGDNPFSFNGAEFLDYMDKNDRFCLIRFKIGLTGAYIGEGKVVKFLPTEPIDLKKYIEAEYTDGRFPQVTPATIDKIDGLTSVSLMATRPSGVIRPYFLFFRWIQIETNIVVKIDAVSCNTNTFKVMTNSLQFIKINKRELLKALTAKN